MILKKKPVQSHKRGESPTITLAREIDGTYCCSGQMCFEGHAVSIIGTRSEQQDSYAMLTMHAEQSDGPEALLAIVCDGIGGFSAGQEAMILISLIQKIKTAITKSEPLKTSYQWWSRLFRSKSAYQSSPLIAQRASPGWMIIYKSKHWIFSAPTMVQSCISGC